VLHIGFELGAAVEEEPVLGDRHHKLGAGLLEQRRPGVGVEVGGRQLGNSESQDASNGPLWMIWSIASTVAYFHLLRASADWNGRG